MPLAAATVESLSKTILDYSVHRQACTPAVSAPVSSALPRDQPVKQPSAGSTAQHLAAATALVSDVCGKATSFIAGDFSGLELQALAGQAAVSSVELYALGSIWVGQQQVLDSRRP